MAYRLGDYVVYGELHNTRYYTTFGLIALRGEMPGKETILRLDLTGDCATDLRGKTFRFMPPDEEDSGPIFRKEEHVKLMHRQIGATGLFTSQGWVRTLPCPVDEYMRRSELGEPPPTKWKRRLYLEWYGPNGRVVVEMAGAIVEERIREAKDNDDLDEWQPIPNLAFPPGLEERPAAGPEITLIRRDDDGSHIEHIVPGDDFPYLEEENSDLPESDDLALDILDGEDKADDDPIAEIELLDDCIEDSDGEPLDELLGGLSRFPRVDALNDEEAEAYLKTILGQLALINVSLDVCQHLKPRECYRILLDTILKECTTYREMIGTNTITHISTSDFCPACEEEMEKEYLKFKREMKKKSNEYT